MTHGPEDDCQHAPPTISVGIPVYNGERFLERALDALLAEGLGDNLEILISDNASTDRTQEICESYAGRFENVHYSREPINRGAAYNYNRVLSMANGVYFKWNAHDDFITPGYFQKILSELEVNANAIGVFSNALYVDDFGRTLYDSESAAPELARWGGTPFEQATQLLEILFKDGQVAMAFVMGTFKTEALRNVRQLGNYYGADWIVALELVLSGEVRYVRERLLYFTRHVSSSSFRAVPNAREQQEFFDPSVKSRLWIKLQHRRRFLEVFRSISLANGSFGNRAALQVTVIRFFARRASWRIRYALGSR